MRTLWKLGSLLPGRIAKNIDTRGEVFFQSGWLVVSNLDKLAGLLRRRDLSSVGNLYAASFSGTSFSLVDPGLREDANGVRIGAFRPSSPISGPQEAIHQWQSYLQPFVQIEHLSLHLDHLDVLSEDGRIQTMVRLELIGTLQSEIRSGVDRLCFQVTWQTRENCLQITAQSLLRGERILCDQPHFAEVGGAAGIDFPQWLLSLISN